MLTREDTWFQFFSHLMMGLFAVFCVFPIVLLAISSFADNNTILREGYSFAPSKFSLEAYAYLFGKSGQIGRAYLMSIFVTVIGTFCSLAVTSMLAYPISRKDMPLSGVLAFAVFFTMLFNGGLVPSYLMYANYFGVKNTIYGLLVPGLLMNGYNVLLMRSYYRTSIPMEVLEAARIDGAGEVQTFVKVVLPMSTPIIATVALFSGIAYWNDWFNGFIYITSRTELYTVQNLLNRMMQDIQYLTSSAALSGVAGEAIAKIPSVTVRMAIAVVGILPIMIIYPFLQNNFVKGITLGAVKG